MSSHGHGNNEAPGDAAKASMIESTSPAAASPYPFDEIIVADKTGARRNLSPGEFFALPLAERIQYVIEQKASFFASGRQLDPKEALGLMRKLRASIH